MGATSSQLGSWKGESRSLLSPNPAMSHKASTYSSTCSHEPFTHRAPCEEAAGGSSVTCPTCQGSGEIPRELEKQLVALIPYGDQRLKPRHTKLFVFLTVLTCLVTSTFVVFFLFPRSVAVQPVGLNSSTVAFDKADIHLNMTNVLNISNRNYYPITVTQLAIEVLHLSLVVGQASKRLLLPVGPLASEQVLYTVTSRLGDENTLGTLTCSYLSHSEELVFQNYEYVDCRGNSSGAPVLAPLPP
ncbi:transmembrane protein 106A isoform X2 [Tenrec ecaudatus]|uniref:transmembrane protein 106A isoform X2 n=1 Tax=Tenrec ecaudatus TaxID=94439 RepID=UPI003F59E0B4